MQSLIVKQNYEIIDTNVKKRDQKKKKKKNKNCLKM